VTPGAVAPAATGQTLPPPPSGFQIDSLYAQLKAQMRAAGVGDGVVATKANDKMSEYFRDPKILFSYGWNFNAAGKTIVKMLVKEPQDPAKESPIGFLDEPVSKQAYKGGVLEWRKQTWPAFAGHHSKDKQVVFYRGHWAGYAGNRLIGISVINLYNSQGPGQAWIDEYIEKVMRALTPKGGAAKN
jgi:hypothetical protein